MKGRKIVLVSYKIEIAQTNGTITEVDYDVRRSMGDIILAPQLKLNGSSLMKNWKIAEKIINCKEEFVLLTPEEYLILRNATEEIDVFTKNDVELVKRIHGAVEVEVAEKEE